MVLPLPQYCNTEGEINMKIRKVTGMVFDIEFIVFLVVKY